jgi:hypothetical protein
MDGALPNLPKTGLSVQALIFEYFRLNIEYLRYSSRREPLGRTIDFKKGGAKPPARRGCSAYASESDIHKYSIVNLQFRLVRVGFVPYMLFFVDSDVVLF